jgi:hypothetical protein
VGLAIPELLPTPCNDLSRGLDRARVFVEALSVGLLALALAGAVARPWGRPEAVIAVPAAALLIGAGAIPPADARAEAARLGPVIGFLAAVLVLAQLCEDEGLFGACGAWKARTAAVGVVGEISALRVASKVADCRTSVL